MAREAVTLVRQGAYWFLRWHDPATGKKRGKSLGRVDRVPMREAKKKRDLFAAELQRSPHLRNPERAPTLQDFSEYFLACKRDEGASTATIQSYEYAVRLLKEFFGGERRLDTITKADARAFRSALVRNELAHVYTGSWKRYSISQTTVNKHLRFARALFQFAATGDSDIIDFNPFSALRSRPTPSKAWRAVTLDEFWRLYEAAPGGYKTLIAICRLAALRRSDALALRWSDVDFENGMLRFTAIKTGREQRVPMCRELRDILTAIPRDSLRLNEPVVLQTRKGRRSRDPNLVRTHNIGRTFRRICSAAGIAFYTDPCHTLRKSCIDDWARRHPPNAVQAWAGHSTIATTMKHYTRVSPEDERRAQGSVMSIPGGGAGALEAGGRVARPI